MLGSETAIENPKNHCVSVLDHFEDTDDPSMSYMVMPFLRPIDHPAFETVRDVVDFVDQMLEVSVLDKVWCLVIIIHAGHGVYARAGCCP